ncbi:MAG: response regulator [Candidatus Paceibacterota bacterium]
MTDAKKKILLVDDDTFLLDMYSIKFKEKGFEVHTAPSGEDVIQKLTEGFVPDIILLDIVMPAMDGIEILEKIMNDKLAPSADIIMLSNQSAPATVDRALELGAKGYIIKASTIPSEVYDEVIKIVSKK